MTIEEFLRTKANIVPGTDIWTWRWWGEDYFARRAEHPDSVTIALDINDPNGLGFPTQALMAQVYEHID
jgi:hypothetical protein